MFFNYLKIAFRNFLKFKAFSLINIIGLATGITCCIIITLYVTNELSYDRFQQSGERIYRLNRQANDEGRIRNIAVTSGPYAKAILTDYPEDIEAVTRVMITDGLMTYKNRAFREEKIFLTDANFFTFFSFPVKTVDPVQVLSKPNSVVISQEMAYKYFADEDPIGKTITLDKEYTFIVSGIFDESPGNSHLDFDFVASIELLNSFSWFDRWWNNSLGTYVRLQPGVTQASLEAKLPAFMEKYFGEDFKKSGRPIGLILEPLKNIYFNNETSYDMVKHGDRQIVYIFSAVALLILLIACINFMNLATARSTNRAMEVGLRKVLGAYRSNLVIQFLGEAIILTLLASVLAIGLSELILPFCNDFFHLNLSIDYTNWRFYPVLFGGAVLIGIISGMYPAFFLSSTRLIKVLKAARNAGAGGSYLRKILVILQFSVTIILVISTIVILNQLDYIGEKNLGFNKGQVVLVPITNSEFRSNRESFKNEILRSSEIESVSMMSGEPGGFHDNFAFKFDGISGDARRMRTVFTDRNYCKTMEVNIVAGRDFSEEYGTDDLSMILNETAVKSLGWTNEEALGKQATILLVDSLKRTVVGVVSDYNFTSLKSPIEPLAISIRSNHRVIAARIKPGQIPEALNTIKLAWNHAAPGYPFEYKFLDDSFDNLYQSEKSQRQIFGVFAFIAITIACLGLFGMAAYMAERRTKEIGIRKVLGASVAGIVGLMSNDFIKPVLLANLLAWPVAWFIMEKWLQDFAYRVEISWWVFVLAGVLALVIALLTVSWQAIKAALANPIESLRYE